MDIITVSIAVAVAMIGYFQLRTAQQQVALDLFDRRIETYSVLREVVAAVHGSSSAATPENELKFLRAVDRAEFLFGQEIIRELNVIHKAITEVCVSLAENDAAAERKWREVALNGFYKLQPLFARYLRMDQRLPQYPWN
jgi:hypothetical protein